jgi:hypothetical protein
MRPNLLKTYMLLQNLDNSSVISGEATNENFGAGDRQKGILVDEYGRIDHNMALNINDSVHDTSKCVIFNSTHFWGVEHPYNQLINQKFGTIPVTVMPWHMNPTKNKGLYLSPEYDVVEISDIDYYRKELPEVFNHVEPMKSFKVSDLRRKFNGFEKELDKIEFVADGGDSNEGGWRSLWYDQVRRTRRDRDVACNIDRRPRGSGASVFTPATLHRIEQKCVYPPTFKGDIIIGRDKEYRVRTGKVVQGGVGRLRWWKGLTNGRPRQDHNYIVGCDIGLGRGASNSVASIVDVNTCEEVGKWICPNTAPESFADNVVALCKWVGGKTKEPYLIWESNGPGGVFEGRVIENQYNFVYVRRDEKAKRKSKQNKLGWNSSKGPDGTKFLLMMGLDVALKEGLEDVPHRKFIRMFDVNNIREMETYLFNGAGTPHPAKTVADEDTDATAAHGDRVIALGLCVLALQYQPRAAIEKSIAQKRDTLGNRMRNRKQEARKKKQPRFNY